MSCLDQHLLLSCRYSLTTCLAVTPLGDHDYKVYSSSRFPSSSSVAWLFIELSQLSHFKLKDLTTNMSHPLQVSATAGKADFSRPVNVSALNGKSVLVTGGASGLGAAFVRGFAEAGYVRTT